MTSETSADSLDVRSLPGEADECYNWTGTRLKSVLCDVCIQGVTKRYGTNFRTHSSHLEDEIMLYEHGSGNALCPC